MNTAWDRGSGPRAVQRSMIVAGEWQSETHIRIWFGATTGVDAQDQANDREPRLRQLSSTSEHASIGGSLGCIWTSAGRTVLDFIVHVAGPATRWALAVNPGQMLLIGAEAQIQDQPDSSTWRIVVGDDTSIATIGKRFADLRTGLPIIIARRAAHDFPAGNPVHPKCPDGKLIDRVAVIRALGFPLENGEYDWFTECPEIALALRQDGDGTRSGASSTPSIDW